MDESPVNERGRRVSDRTIDSTNVHLGGGFSEADRGLIESTLSQLLSRAASSDRAWEMELSVKDREAPGQYVTLAAWVPGKERFVATSSLESLRDALNDVGSDILRQFNRARERDSQDHRDKRGTIRGQ